MRTGEREVEDERQALARLRAKLDAVQNERQYSAVMMEEDMLRREKKRREELILEKMEAIENLESEREDLAGRPWVADMIFTRCAATCPLMTAAMEDLGAELPEGVRRVSISVDPVHDRPEVLAEYARSHGVGPDDDWLFLTGPRPEVIDLVQEGFKLGVAEDPANEDEPITHSTKFVLVDGEGRIRGYYDGLDPGSRDELVEAAEALRETGAGS